MCALFYVIWNHPGRELGTAFRVGVVMCLHPRQVTLSIDDKHHGHTWPIGTSYYLSSMVPGAGLCEPDL